MPAERISSLARDERVARLTGFGWGFAEGVFFFIVPDVYVTLATLFSVRAGAMAWVSSIGGSLAGVAAICLLQVVLALDYVRFLTAIPGVSGALIDRVSAMLAAGGLPYTPLLVLGGVPLKVYAAAAFAVGVPVGAVLLWRAFARIVRIAPAFVVAVAVRLTFRRSIDAHAARWSVVWGVVWIMFYVFYFVQIG